MPIPPFPHLFHFLRIHTLSCSTASSWQHLRASLMKMPTQSAGPSLKASMKVYMFYLELQIHTYMEWCLRYPIWGGYIGKTAPPEMPAYHHLMFILPHGQYTSGMNTMHKRGCHRQQPIIKLLNEREEMQTRIRIPWQARFQGPGLPGFSLPVSTPYVWAIHV